MYKMSAKLNPTKIVTCVFQRPLQVNNPTPAKTITVSRAMARSAPGISVKPNCAARGKTCGDEAAKMKPAISKHKQKQERRNGQARFTPPAVILRSKLIPASNAKGGKMGRM